MMHLHEKNTERKRINGLIARSPMKVPGERVQTMG